MTFPQWLAQQGIRMSPAEARLVVVLNREMPDAVDATEMAEGLLAEDATGDEDEAFEAAFIVAEWRDHQRAQARPRNGVVVDDEVEPRRSILDLT